MEQAANFREQMELWAYARPVPQRDNGLCRVPEANLTVAYEIIFVILIGRIEVHAVRFSDLADLVLAAGEPDKARVELLNVILHLRRAIPTWVHSNKHRSHDRSSVPAFVESVDNYGDLLQLVRTDVRAEGEAKVEQGPATFKVGIRKRLSILVDLYSSQQTS